MFRINVLTALLALALPTALASGPDSLPDIGSSAGELLTPAKQAEYGAMLRRELRNYGYLLDDPQLEVWVDDVGRRLGAASAQPQQPYTFFLLRDRQINAFATLGGYVGVNAGLVLMAEREDEVAAVLAHEVAHVTQQHVLRGVERTQRDQIPILLGMLAAIVAAQQAGGNSAGEATMASVTSAMGLMQQRQINYTRANESEADRLGIRTLSRTGYDIDAMAGMFERMATASRANEGGYQIPDFLRTHPVNVTRISEAKQRAEQIRKEGRIELVTTTPEGQRREWVERQTASHPTNTAVLSGWRQPPAGLKVDLRQVPATAPGQGFAWAQERLRVLSAPTPATALQEYETLAKRQPDGLSPPQRYGLALARLQSGVPAPQAISLLEPLLEAAPQNLWLELALAEAYSRAGKNDHADALLQATSARLPGHRAVVLTRAELLNARGTAEAGQQALILLRDHQSTLSDDPSLHRQLARAWELSGDSIRAGEAHAEMSWLNGRAEQALLQLQTLRRRDDLDYTSQARIEARIETLTPEVLELKRQGIHDPVLKKP